MTPSGALRAAVFASVSTPQQASSEKDSLPSQLRDGQAWAESVGGQVVVTYSVPGHSRKYIFYQEAERDVPAYRELREDCEAGAFDVLWCRARDRLGRTPRPLPGEHSVASPGQRRASLGYASPCPASSANRAR